jgi:hypothetical protein
MSRRFEINIMLRVSSSHDVAANHLEGHFRQPATQDHIRAVVEGLLPLLETKERKAYPYYDCVVSLVTVAAVD